jgi:putative two-component system response regulator
VSQLSGTLSVDSTLGEGTTFALTIPIEQPTPGSVVTEMQAKLDASHKQSLAYARDIRTLYEKLQQHFIETLHAITEALEARDDYLRGHTERVTQLALDIGREMDLSAQQLESLELGSRVHDIGKIGMPDAVLYEADGLPDREYAIRYHVDRGEQILSPLEFLEDALPIALSHHARFDGQGYPDGLSGLDIPLGGRILAVANDFDIMTSPRPHRTPLPREEALATIRAGAGSEWDPDVVQAFLKVMDRSDA